MLLPFPRHVRRKQHKMGLYTSIRHPYDGRELQIKTGHDSCDWYNIGDTVFFFIDKDIYESYTPSKIPPHPYSDKGDDDWVIIKDHKIIAVVPRCETLSGKEINEAILSKRYKIRKPSKSLWTKKAYEESQQRKHEHEKEFKEFSKNFKGSPLAAAMCFPLLRHNRQMLSIEPLKGSTSDEQ